MPFYRDMTCENVTIKGDKGSPITAYVAKPSGAGPFPGVVLIHHLPGWSELYIETTRRFAHHGYMAICANLYEREGGQANPDDVAAKVLWLCSPAATAVNGEAIVIAGGAA